MARVEIEAMRRMLEEAYRTDPFSALRKNLSSVRPDEWDVLPAGRSAEEFGNQPELSICDIALHTGAKCMYADRAFGDATLEWHTIQPPPSRRMDDVLAWLDEAPPADDGRPRGAPRRHAALRRAAGAVADAHEAPLADRDDR
jgi:hypothetical protein